MKQAASHEILEHLLDGRALVDVRAPVEYAKGTIPNAVNLPIINDEERAAIGTTYKKEGQAAAIELAQTLVSGEIRESRIQAWVKFFRKNPNARIFCFRGGLRSRFAAESLIPYGIHTEPIPGGYKYLRRLLTEELEAACTRNAFAVVSGYTGSGKTELLRQVVTSKRVLDLEHFARHRGSAFGRLFTPQPTQINFENETGLQLARLTRSECTGPILVEDESRQIGSLVIPRSLFDRISASPVYVIERPRSERARRLVYEYLLDKESPCAHETAEGVRHRLTMSLNAIKRRLGGADHAKFMKAMNAAVDEQARTGSVDAHIPWIEDLLARYYDPLYERHLERIRERIRLRGTVEEVAEALSSFS